MKSPAKTPSLTDPRSKQGGVALIFVLLMLSVIFVMGAISARLATNSERMARADRDRQIARQAAEVALADAERDLMDPNTSGAKRACQFPKGAYAGEPGCSADSEARGVCVADPAAGDTPLVQQVNFDDLDDSTRRYAVFGEFTGDDGFAVGQVGTPSRLPAYIIEDISAGRKSAPTRTVTGQSGALVFDQTKHGAYLITAVGFGINESTRVVLEATVIKLERNEECASSTVL
jgi:type IV pilus assembly protein PilX